MPLERRVDCAQPDAREVGLRPAAAEEVRAALRTEGLGAPLVGLIRADEIVSRDEANRLRANVTIRRADAARDLLARRAVAERHVRELVQYLESNAAALTASLQHRHGSSVASRRLRRSAANGCFVFVKPQILSRRSGRTSCICKSRRR